MDYAFGVIFFVVALLASVMAHEAGHFLTARWFGMKASRFFVGFGPTLWSTHRGETEYGVKAIPAGGFVKIVGMTPLEEIEPGDENRAFYRFPAPQRAVVLVAGSVVHFVLALLLLFAVLATTGDILKAEPSLTIDTVSRCIPLDPNESACSARDPKAPAFGKLQPGDHIVAVDGTRVTSYDDMRARVSASPGRTLTLTVLRHGQTTEVRVTPATVTSGGHTVGRVGVSPTFHQRPLSVLGAVPRTFTTLGEMTVETGRALGDLPHQVSQILQGKPRPANGAASVVDIARVSGQIAQAKVSFGTRLANLVAIVAQLNFFVGVFNLLPLLPLDGGHVGILVFEQVRSRLYRLFGRRDPGRVDLMKIMPFTYAVVAVFVGLSLLLLYAGIVNPIKIQ
jgi:membrane-associated protease RseP (regulator of RpoE activity)